MEEENWCTPDITNSVLQHLHQDSWTSVEPLHGDPEASERGRTEETMNVGLGTEKEQLRPNERPQSQEEVEEWEQIIWPVRPITHISPQLSFATVQWDLPDAAAETPPLLTDGASANGRNCTEDASVTCFGPTSTSLYQPEDGSAELFKQEDAEEHEGFDSRLLESALQWTGYYSEPCDAAEVQEPEKQEKEDSRHDLFDIDNGVPLITDPEEEERRSGTSDPLQTEDFIDSVGEIRSSEDEEDSFIHLKLEEEQEEPCFLLTGQQEPEEHISTNSVQIKEENHEDEEVEEDQTVIYDFCSEESQATKSIECQRDPEVPADPLQTEDSELTGDQEKLRELLQSELAGETLSSDTEDHLTVQTDRSEMREEVSPNLDLQQSEAVDNSEETSTQEEDNAEKSENSQQISEKTENLEGASFLEQETGDQLIVQDREDSQETRRSEEDTTEKPGQTSDEELKQTHDSDHLGESQQLEQAAEMELTDAEQSVQSSQTEPTVCDEAEESGDAEQPEQTESPEQSERPPQTSVPPQPPLPEQPQQSEKTNESEVTEQLSREAEVTQQTEPAESNQVHKQAGDAQTVVANGEPPHHPEPRMNGGEVDREMARRLAERLFNLDGIQRADVVKHIDKDNDFSRAVGEEYLSFFDFTGQNLDPALRSFLKVVILIGETQERERVLQHFSCRFHQCNPDSFSSSGAVLALTCALMLLNTDLHGQHVGKSMSSSKFVSNLDGMNEGENFNKDLLKTLYSSIKTEPLQWAVDEEELKNSVLLDEDAGEDAPLRSQANPFQVVPHDSTAAVIKQGFLLRKLHADIDGKRTPWGRRGWKTFYGVLRGMVLYLQKDDYRKDQPTNEEVVSVHHSLAEQASEYTKKPNVFRLQTADWRVFLCQASSKVEMNLWISRINLVAALHSSPPFPAAVGSQRRFYRPILPASQSAHTLESQLQSHAGMLESFKADLSYLQQNPPEGRKAKAKDLEEQRVRAEYLQHEVCRYETYMRVLEAWQSVEKTEDGVLNSEDLSRFDKAVSASSRGEEEEELEDEGMLKKSYSSPSLELEGLAPPQVVKVKRNISERRTYRRVVIPRWNKEA